MLFDYLFDSLPLVLAFATPMMPQVDAPPSPLNSADAERRRQEVADAALRDVTRGGRASTIRGGNAIAYTQQARRAAGTDLMAAGSSRDLGM